MRLWKIAGLTGALAAASLLIAACGGDGDNGGSESQTGIRTDKGLSVAAIGAGLDPRLQGEQAVRESSDQSGSQPVPGGVGFAGTDIADGDTRYYPYYAPALQESGSGITVQGYGSATADADSAIVEFYFYTSGSGGVEPQPAPDTSSRSSGGSAGSAGIAEPAPPQVDFGDSLQEVPPITEASLQPVIDALVGAGIARGDIEVIGQGYYDKYSSSATLRATVGNLDVLDGAVNAATNAAASPGAIQLSSTNVAYTVSDCTALEKAAMQAATEDAEERGAAFAETLGVGMGGIVGASHYSYSPYGGNACGSAYGGPYPLAAESFVAGGSRTVQVFANISVTYAIQ